MRLILSLRAVAGYQGTHMHLEKSEVFYKVFEYSRLLTRK